MKEHIIENADTINAGIDADRLGQLAAADQDGRCKILPCAVGSTVWIVYRSERRVQKAVVSSFHMFDTRRDTVETCELGGDRSKIFRRWKMNQFGKTLFLSEADARAALLQQK